MRTLRLLVCLASVLFLAGPAKASAAVGVGHSGWTWGNPLPQGDEIRGLEFAGSRGYAAGKFGSLLRTDDAGGTWTGIATGITQDLARVRIIDSDSVVIAGGCALRRSDDAGQSFSRLPWTASDLNCPSPIVSLSFPSEAAGYLLIANGTVFRTADGGRTWTRKTAVPGTQATGAGAAPTDIFFTGADTGIATTSAGRIYRTTDGGGSWTLVLSHSQPLNGLFFIDANTGYAVGNGSSVFKTGDGGVTWTAKQSGSLTLTSIRCASATTCLATVDTGDRVLRTTDGGDTFTSVTPSTDKIFAAAFASPTRAIAAGAFGTTVVSGDSGATWSSVGGRLSGTFTQLRATSASLAFAAGDDGLLARTTDGGNSWTALGVSTSQNVQDVSFPTQNIGYALDSAGAVLKTDNAGASWQILNTGTSTTPYAIFAPDVNTVLLIGPRGIRRSADGGNEFARIRQKAVAKAPLEGFDLAGRSIFAWGFRSLVVSTNRGKTWKKVGRPSKTSFTDVDFVTNRIGFGVAGRLWQTRNGGRTWKELPAIGTTGAFDLAFNNARKGFALVNSFGRQSAGYVYGTSDGGKSWRPQLVTNEISQRGRLVALGASGGLYLAGPSSLFATTTGGDQGTPSTLKLKTKKRKLRRNGTIKVTGKLSPAEGGEQVIVSMRSGRALRWNSKLVTVASNGAFTTSWKVTGASVLVAQWAGDDDRTGDGSPILAIKVGRRI